MQQKTDTDEIIAFIKALNACWTNGDVDELNDYFHKNMVAITASDRQILEGRDACLASWRKFTEVARIHRWREDDIKVRFHGNTAIVTYYFDMSFEIGERKIDMGGRDMFVLVRENGRWWAVADQFSAYPSG